MTHRVELNDSDIASEFNKKAESIKVNSLALDESSDMKDAAQILILSEGLTAV